MLKEQVKQLKKLSAQAQNLPQIKSDFGRRRRQIFEFGVESVESLIDVSIFKMCDIFMTKDVRNVFAQKSVLFLGDSIMRNIYKDFISLTHNNPFTPVSAMRAKGERSYREDRLIHASRDRVGRNYEEERDFYYERYDLQYSFIFITRCYSRKLLKLLENYPKTFGSYPDVMIINSVGYISFL